MGDGYLFYQAGIVTGQGLWMAGPSLSQFSGGLASLDNSLCVEQVPSALWRYADGQAWRPDSGLEVICKDEFGPVECMWNDGVRFIGGDMKGDDHHGTRQESASGCREKCDGTEGCNYWSWRRSGAGMNCWLKREKQEEVRETVFISGSISSVCIVTPLYQPVGQPEHHFL